MDVLDVAKILGAGSPSLILAFAWYKEWKRSEAKDKECTDCRSRHDNFIERLLSAQLGEEKKNA